MFCEKKLDWKSAIRKSCEPLLADGTVDATYPEEIIKCIEKHGPYIVILPGIALPHSTENAKGAHGTAISFMKCTVPVTFENDSHEQGVKIFFTISSTNSDEHLMNMQRLYSVLTNEEAVEKLKNIENPEELLAIDSLCEQNKSL